MCQCCKSKIVKVLQSEFRSNFFQTLNCDNVDGILDGLAYCCRSAITFGSIIYR